MLHSALVKWFSFIVVGIVAGFLSPAVAQQPAAPAETVPEKAVSSPQMRRQFEGLYEAWRQAMGRKDFAAWQKTTAQFRQAETRNRIVSQMLRYPDVLFSAPMAAPDLAELMNVDVLVRGDTASSVYFGKADFGVSELSEVADNLIVLSFIREYGIWKFDKLRVVKIGDNSDVLLQIRNGDRQFLEGPEFQPPGKAPKVPGLVSAPDFVAEVRVRAIGYRVSVQVNNQHRHSVSNRDARELVNGGLRAGQNRIRIVTSPVEVAAGTVKNLEIAVYAADAPNKPARRVYHFRPERGDAIPEDFSAGFAVRKEGN